MHEMSFEFLASDILTYWKWTPEEERRLRRLKNPRSIMHFKVTVVLGRLMEAVVDLLEMEIAEHRGARPPLGSKELKNWLLFREQQISQVIICALLFARVSNTHVDRVQGWIYPLLEQMSKKALADQRASQKPRARPKKTPSKKTANG